MNITEGSGTDKEAEHIISCDRKGNLLEGGKKYKFRLSSDIPVLDFWSVVVYDMTNRLIIHTDQPWPSVHSNKKNLIYSNDGSVDVWFSTEPPKGKRTNWIKTIPGRSWYMILRLYFPQDGCFDREWLPGEIEELI